MEKLTVIFKDNDGKVKRFHHELDSIEAIIVDRRVVYPDGLRERDFKKEEIDGLINVELS